MSSLQSTTPSVGESDDAITLGEMFSSLRHRKKFLAIATVVGGLTGFGVASIMTPIFTATAVIMPPQQQASAAASALGSLSVLAGLAGGGIKTPADQYIGFMHSATVSDQIIDRFHLMQVYDDKYRADARKRLEKNASITLGKTDGLITIEVDDPDPKRAADIANAFVDGLRFMTNHLAVTDAQQRRSFFELKLGESKDKLTQAQIALQASGFNAGAIKAEPRAAADAYAKLSAQAAEAEVKLQSLRSGLADSSAIVIQQQATLDALRSQITELEKSQAAAGAGQIQGQGADYVTKYREYQYQQTLFELLAKQYEAARLDEAREGALIQVIDPATVPEKKSKPRRLFIAIGAALAGLVFSGLWLLARSTRESR